MFQFDIKIPIRSHLKKMIAYNREITPFIVTFDKDHYAAIFYQAFERDSFTQNSFKSKLDFNDSIELSFPPHIAKENRFTLSRRRLSYIDAQLRSIFDEKLFDYLNDNCFGKGDIQKYSMLFMDKYEITEDEITLDALIKSYQRYRQKTDVKDKVNFRAKANYHKPRVIKETVQKNLFN